MQLTLDFGEIPKKRPKKTPPKPHLVHEEEPHNAEQILTRRLQSQEYKKRLEKVTIGATIRKLRIRNRMKQADLARKLKTTQSVIARIEGGKQNITLDLLHKIATVFGKKVHITMR